MKKDFVPPWFLFNFFIGLLNVIERLKNRLLPPQLRLWQMISGGYKTQIIRTAAELRIIDFLLESPKSLTDLATCLHVDEKYLHRLMRILCCMDIVKKGKNDTYTVTSMGAFLSDSDFDSMRATAIFFGRECYGGLQGLTQSIKTGSQSFDHIYGTTFFDYMSMQADSARYFDDSLTEATIMSVPAILAEYDFSSFQHAVDIGGGKGYLLFAILDKYPNLRGTIFDQESVIEKAIARSSFGPRCNFIAGNFIEKVPEGGDLYILKRVLHDWNDKDAEKILRNCRKAITDQGRLILIEPAIDETENDFDSLASDLLMLVLLNGKERNEIEFKDILHKTGFRLKTIIKTRSFERIIEAECV